MLERILENWLTRSGERGFEVPFAQLLISEGYRVIQGPAHHPFEHGKDIIALDPQDRLWAFQLKGGDIDLADFERIQGQLLALAGTAVTYPGVEPPRRPDRVALVTTGILTPPVRDRIHAFNQANRPLGFTLLESIEREHLTSQLLAAHGKYLPVQPEDLNDFLRLLLEDGRGPFPVRPFTHFMADTIGVDDEKPQAAGAARSIASAILLTAYATGPWERQQNHLGAATGWLALAATILHFAARHELDEALWGDSYELAMAAARARLGTMLSEAAEAEDLLIPDIVEGVVYPTRALLLCGYAAAFFLSERLFGLGAQVEDSVKGLLRREMANIKVITEFAAPYLAAIGSACELMGDVVEGRRLVLAYAQGLASSNQGRSEGALPDPYHDFDDALRRIFGADVDSPDEKFNGNAYTLHIAVEWLTRRNEREAVTKIWPDLTRLSLCEFKVSRSAEVLALDDDEGVLAMWQAAMPESWGTIRGRAGSLKESELPSVLWRNLEFLPYLLLLYPHRYTEATAKAQDYAVANLVTVELDVSGPAS